MALFGPTRLINAAIELILRSLACPAVVAAAATRLSWSGWQIGELGCMARAPRPTSPGPALAQTGMIVRGRQLGPKAGLWLSSPVWRRVAQYVGSQTPVIFVEHDPDEPADRHAEERCLLLDKGELLEQGIALGRRQFLENGDHLQRGCEGSPCNRLSIAAGSRSGMAS